MWGDVQNPPTPEKVRARLDHIVKCLAVALFFALLSLGWAQEKNGISLAIDGAFFDDAGPFYFKNHDDDQAFVLAGPFAQALGLELEFDDVSKTLTFSDGVTWARLQTTGDIAQGLVPRPGNLTIDGGTVTDPGSMGILVDGVSYVPIDPIVAAFGGISEWHIDFHLITITTVNRLESTLPIPRIGFHDRYTRVALELPAATSYHIAAGGQKLVVVVPGGEAPNYLEQVDNDQIQRVSYQTVDGETALVIETRHLVTSDGRGFRSGTTAAGVLYLDLGPDLTSEPVAALDDKTGTFTAAETSRATVVIDAGHGGGFPGARGYAIEEDVVLAIAFKVKALLESQGVAVILTRDGNYQLSETRIDDLFSRASFATPNRNLFVSIHANGHDTETANGIETLVFGQPLDPKLIETAIKENGGGEVGRALTEEALASAADIAGNILRESQLNYSLELAETVQRQLISATEASDRGIKQAPLIVLNRAQTPAILVEVGFVTHPEEGALLTTDRYQQILAEGLSIGILEFLQQGTLVFR